VRQDGTIRLPKEAMEALDVGPGSYLKVTIHSGRVELVKTVYDPWEEGQRKKKTASFEELLKRQKEDLAEAERDFMEKLKKPPDVRPEDRLDFWD